MTVENTITTKTRNRLSESRKRDASPKIIELASQGHPIEAIARELNLSVTQTTNLWRDLLLDGKLEVQQPAYRLLTPWQLKDLFEKDDLPEGLVQARRNSDGSITVSPYIATEIDS